MKYVKPKKHLGQHFLTDKNIARKIVDAFISLPDIQNCFLIEVGPGKGILTDFLLKKTKKLTVVEIDTESVEFLKHRFTSEKINILNEDFLKFDFKKLTEKKTCLIGNFPYNISGPLFIKIYENKNIINGVVCMIQKEVADRIKAKPGSKTYGILSVLIQTFYEVEYLFTVNEKVFNPPPKVKSAVIRLKRNTTKHIKCDEKLYKTIIKSAFNKRRKTLRNSLKEFLSDKIKEMKIFDKRPEQLSVQDFINLVWIIEQNKK